MVIEIPSRTRHKFGTSLAIHDFEDPDGVDISCISVVQLADMQFLPNGGTLSNLYNIGRTV
jgi:hypothetical protein